MMMASELGLFPLVISLRVNENDLTGYIPTELGQLSNSLQLLDISTNPYINGTLPTELGQLSVLTHFVAYATHVHGPIPLEIAALATTGDLSNFHVTQTLLYGTVPTELCSIDALTFDCRGALCGCDCMCGGHLVTMSVNCVETPDLC